jgi:hypothetical protein
VGLSYLFASRLIPQTVIEDSLADVVSQFEYLTALNRGTNWLVVFNQAPTLEASGALSDNSVNPAWRKARIHLIRGEFYGFEPLSLFGNHSPLTNLPM